MTSRQPGPTWSAYDAMRERERRNDLIDWLAEHDPGMKRDLAKDLDLAIKMSMYPDPIEFMMWFSTLDAESQRIVRELQELMEKDPIGE